jgi:hypothetical protein
MGGSAWRYCSEASSTTEERIVGTSISGSYVLKKRQSRDDWELNDYQGSRREVLVEVGHPVPAIGNLPGISFYATVDAAGGGGLYRGPGASDVALYVMPNGFSEIIAAMYRADREATLASIAKAILGVETQGLPSNEAVAASAD